MRGGRGVRARGLFLTVAPDDATVRTFAPGMGLAFLVVVPTRPGRPRVLPIHRLDIVEADGRIVQEERIFCPRRLASVDATTCRECAFGRGESEEAVLCGLPARDGEAESAPDSPLFLGPCALSLHTVLGGAFAPNATAVRVDVPVAEALRILERESVVAVIDADGALRGLLSAAAPPDRLRTLTALDEEDSGLAESASLADAIERLVHGRARFIPVTGDHRRFEGIVADLDVLRWAVSVRAGAALPGMAPAGLWGASRTEKTMNRKADLLRPEAYGLIRPTAIELVQTHISWVFLVDDEVFKVKKPVDLGFLDFRSIEQRRAACEAEVRLNARLAPSVYLGIVAVRRGDDGRCALFGQGPVVDWAVHMRRLPDAERADILLAKGFLPASIVDAIARRIAAFHAAAHSDEATARFATPEAIERNVAENFEQLRGHIGRYVAAPQAEEIARWQLAFVRGHDALFRKRIAAGRVRDGHGDLRLEHVYLASSGEPTILDCIEFSDRLRFGDVCSDIAFLSMDLAAQGRVDLAERLIATYARESGDFDLYPLIDFYESYRACVRGKIAALVADDEAVPATARRRAEDDARRYLLLALSAERRPLVPATLIAVGGLIASGKSTVAERASLEWGLPVVDADGTRKALLGVKATRPVHENAWAGAYDPGFTEKVYAEVLRRAEQVLISGRGVIIDASFRSRVARAAVRDLAGRFHVPLRVVECRADQNASRARLGARARESSVSDGRIEIFDAFRARFEPVDELPPDDHVLLDTSRSLDETIETLRARLDVCPTGLVT
jgi:aminoglycoside phosphotransferase family enzyme/predicted kinase/CBS domain-containing protein